MEASTAPAPAAASSFDAWLLQKLRLEWSSREFGGLLTPAKLAEARASFPHLDTPIKVRLLLALLSVRRDEKEAAAGQQEADLLLRLAEKDAEEWVKVSAGLVQQFLKLEGDADSHLYAQLEATAEKVVQKVSAPPNKRRGSSSSHVALDDVFSLENGLLNTALRAQVAPTAATHFTMSGEDDDANGREDELGASPVKKPLYRPHMARPSAALAASTSTASASTRLTQAAPKPPVGKKKNLTELSSEIRRKADAGRFKRQRSRISMIDINEVKQIESEKAQKAEERKKQKLAAKEKEKEKAKEKEKEKTGAAAAAASSDKADAADGDAVPTAVNEEHAAIAADIFAMHQQPGPEEPVQQYSHQQLQAADSAEQTEAAPATGGDDYVPDGTQALLNAAFHSTQDIMKEVVSQQSQQLQGQQQIQQQPLQALQPPSYQELYRPQQQMQMHHLAPPQQQYHQGFEPEDASMNSSNASGVPMGFGGYSYGATAAYYGDQFGNYGTPQDPNAFGSAGYSNAAMGQPDNGLGNGIGLPPLGARPLAFDPTPPQQQQQQPPHQQQNNAGYMGGQGEYWR